MHERLSALETPCFPVVQSSLWPAHPQRLEACSQVGERPLCGRTFGKWVSAVPFASGRMRAPEEAVGTTPRREPIPESPGAKFTP